MKGIRRRADDEDTTGAGKMRRREDHEEGTGSRDDDRREDKDEKRNTSSSLGASTLLQSSSR